MLARDRRYDGRFYVGVHTTGIYCRPICPARPRLENISFYRSQAEAEGAGFRACLRCRPDLSPTSQQWQGTAAVVGRALTLIALGEADEAPLERLAARLGMSDRHLRRLFEEHLGASPIEVAISKRLHLARHLLLQTNLPVTEIALASGFQSIRRFNAAFKTCFKTPPTALRRRAAENGDAGVIRLELPYLEPYDWAYQVGFLGAHQVRGVERIDGSSYQRVFAMDRGPGWIRVTNDAGKGRLELQVSAPDVRAFRVVIEKTRDLFDLRMNPHVLAGRGQAGGGGALAWRDRSVDGDGRAFVDRVPGIRIPGCWDAFETSVCIILGQLVSIEAAGRSFQKLVERFGHALLEPVGEGLTHLFPTAEVLAGADLTVLGLTRVKAGAISSLARQVAEGRLDLSRACGLEETRRQLLTIKGIGPWTVEMIAMRCLNDTDAFPRNDLIIQRALELHGMADSDWSPYRAYLALAMWKEYAGSLSKKRRGAMAMETNEVHAS
jgi:AraC family transcriptional regulator of adaptative response / DNA-3-methyladenine glycosylase II